MKNDFLKRFSKMREKIERERNDVWTRLQELDAALGEMPKDDSTQGRNGKRKSRKKMSAAGRAAIADAARARWARVRAEKAKAGK